MKHFLLDKVNVFNIICPKLNTTPSMVYFIPTKNILKSPNIGNLPTTLAAQHVYLFYSI